MNPADIANTRIASQHIRGTKFTAVKDLVAWMGAVQAQDYNMAKWAVGIRLPGSTDRAIEAAFNQGEILRTHVLRPTWHFVSADDIRWMLELTAPQIKASLKSRHKQLELTEAVFLQSNTLIENLLAGGRHLTREDLVAELGKAKIATNDNRAAHILLRAELDGVICSGATKDKKQTYALLNERVPVTNTLTRDEALAKLAGRYFRSHGPATLEDFAWWSGLSLTHARHALQMVRPELASETIGSQTYWLSSSFSAGETGKNSVYLLPAYDEFIISYKSRSASLAFEHQHRALSNNGIFYPVIVVNGQVAGVWKRTVKNNRVLIETEFFGPQSKVIKHLVEKEVEMFGHYLNKQVSYRG